MLRLRQVLGKVSDVTKIDAISKAFFEVRMVEALFEAGPQFVLQTSVIFRLGSLSKSFSFQKLSIIEVILALNIDLFQPFFNLSPFLPAFSLSLIHPHSNLHFLWTK